MYVVAVLDHQLDDAVFPGARRQGHVTHPGHKVLQGPGRVAEGRHLAAVHKHLGGVVHRKAAEGVIRPGRCPDAQPVGAVGIVRGRDLLPGRLAGAAGREILAGVKGLGVEIPAALQLEQPGSGVLVLQVQPAVFHPEQLHRHTAQGEQALQQLEGQHHQHNQQQPPQLLHPLACLLHGTPSLAFSARLYFLPYFLFYHGTLVSGAELYKFVRQRRRKKAPRAGLAQGAGKDS